MSDEFMMGLSRMGRWMPRSITGLPFSQLGQKNFHTAIPKTSDTTPFR
jgi:hypothetical protein